MMSARGALTMAGALVAALVVGALVGRGSKADTAALEAKLAVERAGKDSAIAQAAVLARRLEADSLAAVAARKAAQRAEVLKNAAVGTADSLRRALHVVSGTTVAVTSPAGVVDTERVPPAVVQQLIADTAAINAAVAEAGAWKLAEGRARSALGDATAEITQLRAAVVSLQRQIPLERDIAYRHGKAVGRVQGMAIGLSAGVGGAVLVVKLAGVF